MSATCSECQGNLDRFINLCSQLGIPIAPDKTFRPATTLTFAGIELDSIGSEARLPQDKIVKCVEIYFGLFKTQKSTAQGAAVLNWPLKLCNFGRDAREGIFEASLRSNARCDTTAPFYTITF